MNKEYAVNITINNVTNQGLIILEENDIKLKVLTQVKSINYQDISNSYSYNDNGLIIVLNNNLNIIIECTNYNDILDNINNKISKTKITMNSTLFKKPVVTLIICLAIIILFSYFIGIIMMNSKNNSIIQIIGPIFSLIAWILLIIGIIAIIKMIISFFKNAKEARFNNGVRNQMIYKVCLYGLPIFFLVVTIIYHTTGPRGAVNNAYKNDMPSFVSCQKETNSVYTCKRRGKDCIVICKDSKCLAECGW